MNNETLCSANFFFPERHRKQAGIKKILDKFNLSRKDFSVFGNTSFHLEGFEIEEIQENLVKPIMEFLDMEKRSSLFFRDSEGRIKTILIINGKEIHS